MRMFTGTFSPTCAAGREPTVGPQRSEARRRAAWPGAQSIELRPAMAQRHGAGGTIYTYHFAPTGAIFEYAADLHRVRGEARHVPGRWSLDDHGFANLGGPGPPIEIMETATPQA